MRGAAASCVPGCSCWGGGGFGCMGRGWLWQTCWPMRMVGGVIHAPAAPVLHGTTRNTCILCSRHCPHPILRTSIIDRRLLLVSKPEQLSATNTGKGAELASRLRAVRAPSIRANQEFDHFIISYRYRERGSKAACSAWWEATPGWPGWAANSRGTGRPIPRPDAVVEPPFAQQVIHGVGAVAGVWGAGGPHALRCAAAAAAALRTSGAPAASA